jgi:hypothetical protein
LHSQKYAAETPKPSVTEKEMEEDDLFVDMPDITDKQTPKMFLRSPSPRKFSEAGTPGPKVRFFDEKQKTEEDFLNQDFKIVPLEPEHTRRPVSRARLDENTPKLKRDHFVRAIIGNNPSLPRQAHTYPITWNYNQSRDI